jgi:mannose-1-phosphate guanylyltransferase/mannose-6-phosphate isomerase
MMNVTPVILCGGSGTRLWPLSRTGFPKQFLCLAGTQSLFQQTVQRLSTLENSDIQVAPPLVVAGEEHRFLVTEQLREIERELSQVLLEPVGRNTAPALALAALASVAEGQDSVLVVTPADHVVTGTASYARAIQQAITDAAMGSIVILGIQPDRAETGYGYIKAIPSETSVLGVERFVEKPDAVTAQTYLDEGGYYWNAGIFVLRASVWLKALKEFCPDILDATKQAWDERVIDAVFIRPGKTEFAAIPDKSVDYAVMEHCPGSKAFNIKMVPLDAGWSDLGAWDAVWDVLPKDDSGNAFCGDVLAEDSRNVLVHASNRLVSLVGVENVVVVETADAVLVADRSRSQDVKHIVQALHQKKRKEYAQHRKVHRPWGWYDSIDEGSRFKVKRILVNPGCSLSLQMHHHRAEHWVVVTGTAEITCGDKKFLLTENQSTYIPLGHVHRLANPGSIPLEIIEVQSGSYLGEDDIVRLEDVYGRKSTLDK